MGLQDIPATAPRLRQLAPEVGLDASAYRRARELAGLVPDRSALQLKIDRFLLVIAVAFVVAGIAAFFAYNWAGLDKFAKFGLIEAGIVASAVLAWWRGIDSLAGRGLLFISAFLVGVLLAVYGQVYQTGADPYGLFLGWAVLIAGWVLIGRQAGLWMLFAVLLNLSLILYWTQVLYPPPGLASLMQLMGPLVWLGGTVMDQSLAILLCTMNAAALIMWEYFALRGVDWMRGRWFPRLLAVGALSTVTIATLLLIVGIEPRGSGFWSAAVLVVYILYSAACLWYYRFRCHDLLILTACLFSGIIAIATLIGKHIDGFDEGLLVALVIVGLTAGAAFWLRGVSRQWEQVA